MDAPTPPTPVALTPLPSSNRLLPPPQVPLHVGFVGTGLIGKATLKQVGAHAPSLLATGGLDLRIAACADSKHMILASSADGMNPDAVDAAVGDRAVAEWDAGALAAETPVAADLDALVAKIVAHARATPDGAAVIVDNTSSDAVADRYGEWLAQGVHVVTPNKKANSGDLRASGAFVPSRMRAARDGCTRAPSARGFRWCPRFARCAPPATASGPCRASSPGR